MTFPFFLPLLLTSTRLVDVGNVGETRTRQKVSVSIDFYTCRGAHLRYRHKKLRLRDYVGKRVIVIKRDAIIEANASPNCLW